MVFEGAFDKIFSIISEEGGSEGGVVVQVIFYIHSCNFAEPYAFGVLDFIIVNECFLNLSHISYILNGLSPENHKQKNVSLAPLSYSSFSVSFLL